MTRPTGCRLEMPCVSPTRWPSSKASTSDRSAPRTTTHWLMIGRSLLSIDDETADALVE